MLRVSSLLNFKPYRIYDSYTSSSRGLGKYFFMSESLGIKIKLKYLYKSEATGEINSQ